MSTMQTVQTRDVSRAVPEQALNRYVDDLFSGAVFRASSPEIRADQKGRFSELDKAQYLAPEITSVLTMSAKLPEAIRADWQDKVLPRLFKQIAEVSRVLGTAKDQNSLDLKRNLDEAVAAVGERPEWVAKVIAAEHGIGPWTKAPYTFLSKDRLAIVLGQVADGSSALKWQGALEIARKNGALMGRIHAENRGLFDRIEGQLRKQQGYRSGGFAEVFQLALSEHFDRLRNEV